LALILEMYVRKWNYLLIQHNFKLSVLSIKWC